MYYKEAPMMYDPALTKDALAGSNYKSVPQPDRDKPTVEVFACELDCEINTLINNLIELESRLTNIMQNPMVDSPYPENPSTEAGGRSQLTYYLIEKQSSIRGANNKIRRILLNLEI